MLGRSRSRRMHDWMLVDMRRSAVATAVMPQVFRRPTMVLVKILVMMMMMWWREEIIVNRNRLVNLAGRNCKRFNDRQTNCIKCIAFVCLSMTTGNGSIDHARTHAPSITCCTLDTNHHRRNPQSAVAIRDPSTSKQKATFQTVGAGVGGGVMSDK